jgi:hypothetical protein
LFDLQNYTETVTAGDFATKASMNSRDEKLEMSVVNFRENHPTWVATNTAKGLLRRLDAYKEIK